MNVAIGFIFLYFLTLSADLINVDIGFFKLKLPHLVGFSMLALLALFQRGIFLERRYFFCFIGILASVLFSSLFSCCFHRSFVYSAVWVFTFFSYFLTPVNLIKFLEENKLIRIYLASYFVIGSYAVLQFLSSMVGIILPFSVQQMIFVRGSGFAHEPSFYALYAIPFVVFLNSRWLLTKVYEEKSGQKCFSLPFGYKGLIYANLCLLASTSTTAVLSYLVFFVVILLIKKSAINRLFFSGLRRKLLKLSMLFSLCFVGCACVFFELFKKTFLKFFFVGILHESFQDRFEGIVSAVNVFLKYPLFGVGLGGIGPYLYLNEYSPDFQGQITEINRLLIHHFEATNVFTEILGSLGILGFVAFSCLLALIGNGFRKILKDRRMLPSERINVLSFLISIVVILICLQVNQGLFRTYIWVHLGFGVGYVMKIRANCRTREEAEKGKPFSV